MEHLFNIHKYIYVMHIKCVSTLCMNIMCLCSVGFVSFDWCLSLTILLRLQHMFDLAKYFLLNNFFHVTFQFKYYDLGRVDRFSLRNIFFWTSWSHSYFLICLHFCTLALLSRMMCAIAWLSCTDNINKIILGSCICLCKFRYSRFSFQKYGLLLGTTFHFTCI